MRWRKRDLFKMGIATAGILFFLALLVWVPVANAHMVTSGLIVAAAVTVTVQVTPTEDATVTTLSKEQLTQQIAQQQHTWDNWLWSNAATLISSLVLAIAGIFGIVRYFNDRRDAREAQEAEAKRLAEDRKAERERRDEEQQRWIKDQEAEREKRTEERFQATVTGLGDEKEGTRVGAAILLRTFLQPGHEQFYIQTFDLAVANLRLRHLDPAVPEPLTSLSQALVIAFKESFPLAREKLKQPPRSLDASCIQLDNAHLSEADLRQLWLPEASLRNAALRRTDFSEAALYKANLFQADLKEATLVKTNLYKANLVDTDFSNANLSQADLRGADLSRANLLEATLNEANLREACLQQADLTVANLSGTNLTFADFSGTNLTFANFSRANLAHARLRGAKLDYADFSKTNLASVNFLWATLIGTDFTEANLSDTNLEDAESLEVTDLRGATGLTKEQLAACKAKGAIVDEELETSSAQSADAPDARDPHNDAHTLSPPSGHGNTPSHDTRTSSSDLSPDSE